MRPYCASVYCATVDVSTCDGCRLEAACNAMAIGLALAGLAATLLEHADVLVYGYESHETMLAHFAARAGIVLP